MKKFKNCWWVLLFVTQSAAAQFSYKGHVSDNKGVALQGVTVNINGKSTSLTDTAGNFVLKSDTQSSILFFTYVGFSAVQKKFTAGDSINITLSPSGVLLDETVVRAYEYNRDINRLPVTVSVLNKATLSRFDNTSLVAAVNTAPGVKMDERSPGSYRLSIRGNLLRSPFGVRNVKVYWNGIPFTDANGNTYLNAIDLSNIDRVEIIKGPGGSMYGAGTGGVVLLGNAEGETDAAYIKLSMLGGSYGTAGGNVLSHQNNGKQVTDIQYSHLQADGWRDHTAMRRDVLRYTGTFNISEKQKINAHIFYGDLYYQTPGGLNKAQLDANPRQSRPAGGPFQSAVAQQASLNTKTIFAGFSDEYQINSVLKSVTAIYVSHTNFRNPSILNYQRKTELGYGTRAFLQLNAKPFVLHLGGEYQNGFTATRTFANKLGVPDTLMFDDEISAKQYNIFLQAAAELPAGFSLNAGLSYNNYQYGFGRLNKLPFNKIDHRFDPVLVPRISLLKKISNAVNVYATVSKGFSPPTIDEIVPSTGVFNEELQAEKATNYEAGVRATVLPNKLYVEAAYYQLRLKNTIVTRRDAAGSDYFVNAGNTSQRGFEAMVNYYPIRKANAFIQELRIWSSYSYIHARFKNYLQSTNDYSGNKLTGTPADVLNAGIDLTFKNRLYLNSTYNATSAIPLNDANTFEATAYQLGFLKAGYKTDLGKKTIAEIWAAYNKSFKTPYSLGNDLNAAGNRFFNPSAPQTFTAGISLQFGY